jgi:chloride channel 7
MVSTFTLNFVLSIYHGVPGQLSNGGLINFDKFEDMSYRAEEIPVYVLMGILGGLFGALFNHINYKLTLFRKRNVKRRCLKFLEAILVAMSSAMCAFFLIYFDKNCQNIGTDANAYPLQMYCNDGQSSSMATLWFQSPEASVRSLFHDPFGTYEPMTLLLFFIAYFLLACWTYGTSVPSGLFIPGLVIGAAWGRMTAIIIKTIFRTTDWVNPGKFALIGAAAQLGGIVRMTLSLTVILIEATGNISLGLPLMIVLMVAKWTGDMFTEGIYDMHIHLQGVPVLAWEPPAMTSNITAREVMSHPVMTLHTVEKVSVIVDMLKKERHDGFPVVQQTDENDLTAFDEDFNRITFGILEGVITRSQLIVLLRRKYFVRGNRAGQPDDLRLRDFREIYPRFPRIENVNISEEDREECIDLRPFMNPAPYAVFDNTSMPRIFKLFRGLGLRHLMVVNRNNEVIGIVTRKDLARYKFFRHNGRCGILELGMATS